MRPKSAHTVKKQGGNNTMAFTVATFIAFTVLVAVLSWWKTRDDDLSTKEGYFLAGRGLPGIVIAGSLMMTNLSAEQLVGTNGQAFAGNMSTMAWEATSAFALIVLAFVFLPKLLRGGIATIPEFFEMRYDTFTMRLFSLLFLIADVVTMLPPLRYSGAVALVKIFDLESMFGISFSAPSPSSASAPALSACAMPYSAV